MRHVREVRYVLGKVKRMHFVGIGGSGMSGIAELLANLGYSVSGSDLRALRRDRAPGLAGRGDRRSATPRRTWATPTWSCLRRRRAPTTWSSSPRARGGFPVIPRAELLAELMRLRFGIAVAGAHGKTTTTSMIAMVLERAGLDPTAVIGGQLKRLRQQRAAGTRRVLVAEADESDRSFLKLWPSIAVMTNIDREHMEAYGSFAELQQCVRRVRQQGAVLRRRGGVRRRPGAGGDSAAADAAGDHLRNDARRRRRSARRTSCSRDLAA